MLNAMFISFAVLIASLSTSAIVSQSPVLAAQSSGDVIVQTVPQQTVAERLKSRAESSWPWYVTRASGLIAAVALVILILSGIGQVTGYTYRFLDPLTSWASHRALGITFGIAVLVHIFSLYFDKFVSFNLLQLFVPWLSDYRPAVINGWHVGSLWVALGVLAFYMCAVVIITSLIWVEKKPYTWKFIHLLSYLIMLFVFVHALYLGTDLAEGIFRMLWWLFGALIIIACLSRAWRSYTT